MKTGFGINGFSGNFIALLGLACVFSMNLACAQQATTNTDISSLSDLDLMVEAVESTTPVPASELPYCGNYYSAQHYSDWPPLPGNVRGLPAWPLGNDVFLLDDTNVDYAELAQSQAATCSQTANGLQAMSEDSGVDGFEPVFSFSTNSLWLQITGVTGGMANLILNNATDQVYEIWSKTDLTVTNWNIESEIWPTNSSAMPFTVPVLDRTNALFIWARDWTGITENGNTTPDWWFWEYFGTLDLSDTNLDSQGNTLLSDYQNDVDPNIIQFSLQFTNTYLNTMAAYGSVAIAGGTPFYEAILVNDTNTADAVWEPYPGTNLVVSLTSGDGVYNVQVGLRGLSDKAVQTWLETRLILDTVPPVLTITNPVAATVGQPMIQLQGYANEYLSSLTFDVSNAAGIWTNQTGYTTGRFYDTNLLELTTNWFQCYDIVLTNGLNAITLRATDLAGNMTTTNLNLVLDYSSVTNPPVLTVVWPQDGAQIAASDTFTLQAEVNDPTAAVQATISDAAGDTNTIQALVERDGTVLAQNLPLQDITNTVTLTASNAAGYVGQTTLTVYKSAVTVTLNPLSSSQLNQSFVNVSGYISDSSYALTVNGVQATVNGDLTWTADNVPVNAGGTADFDMQVYDSNNNPAGSQTASQSQPVTVALMSYASYYHDTFTGVNEGSGYENFYYNWSYTFGGNYYRDEALWNQGDDDFTNKWYNLLPAGLGALTTTFGSEGLHFVAQSGLMTGTSDNVTPYFNVLLGSYGPYEYQAQTETMIEPSGQQAAGGTALYLVEASAMSYTNVTDALNLDSGEVPVVPEKLAINGQALVNSGITNTDGSVGGMTLISAPAGVPVKLTTTAPAGLYSFTNQVYQLISQCVATTPSYQSRTNLGVGEQVSISFNPPLLINYTNITWSATAGSLLYTNGSSTLFTAPSNAASVTVTATIGSMLVNLDFKVFEPSGYAYAQITGIGHFSIGVAEAQMTNIIWVAPTNVSFYRLNIMEVGEDATNITGYFSQWTPQQLHHSTAEHWTLLNQKNQFIDVAGSGNLPAPYSAGGYRWDIPARWQVVGSGVTNSMNGWNQVFSIDPSGTVTVQKFGHSVTRTTNDVITAQ